MGSPQILICGESGGNGRTYDLAERYRLSYTEIGLLIKHIKSVKF